MDGGLHGQTAIGRNVVEGFAARSHPGGGLTIGTLALAATLATATAAQGGFYGDAQWLIAGGLAIAGSTIMRRALSPTASELGAMVGVWTIVLATWALARGLFADQALAGLSRVWLIATIAIVVTVCRRGTPDDHAALESTGLWIGASVAITGWIGVAAHARPWATTGSSTWRAASTLTYPNAAGAALVVVSLLAVAGRTAQPRSPRLALTAMAGIAGLAATQSRAAAAGLVVGAGIPMVTLGPRRVATAALAPCVGAGIAAGALVPGLAVGGPARPVIAILGLAIGAVIALSDAKVAGGGGSKRRSLVLTGAAGTAAVIAVARFTGGAASALGDRVSLGSADRAGTNRAALEMIGDHPIAGVGPGRLTVAWDTPSGMVGTRLVHNEYIQLVAELGIIGGVLLAGLLASGARTVLCARPPMPSMRWAGSFAALGALLVHSASDFLWHIPAIVLLGAALFGLATCSEPTTLSEHPETRGGQPR